MTQIARIVSDSGAFAYWPMDEATGNVIDQIGGRLGVPTGAGMQRAQPSILPNGEGASAVLSGTNGEYFTVAHDDAFNFVDPAPYSVESWLRPDDIGLQRYAISTRQTPGLLSGYMAPYRNSGGIFQHYRYNAAGTAQNVGNTVAPAGVMAHFVASFDGTTVRTYLNGKIDTTNPATTLLDVVSGPLRLGGSSFGSTSTFFGAMQDIAFYNSALEAARVWQHYRVGTAVERATAEAVEHIYRPIDPTVKGSIAFGPQRRSIDLADVASRNGVITRDYFLQAALRESGLFTES